MPWLIALRVVSLPAADSRMKNEAISADVSRSPSTSACTRFVVRSSAGRPAVPRPGATPYAASSVTALTITSWSPATSSSPAPRITDRPVEDLVLVLLRDAHHVADDLQRQRTGDRATKSACASRWLAVMFVTSLRARSCTLSSMRATIFGVKARLTIDAQPQVTGVVKADHRARELRDLARACR